jgi:hypothetical protein
MLVKTLTTSKVQNTPTKHKPVPMEQTSSNVPKLIHIRNYEKYIYNYIKTVKCTEHHCTFSDYAIYNCAIKTFFVQRLVRQYRLTISLPSRTISVLVTTCYSLRWSFL